MREVNNQKRSILLTVFLLGAQLSLALNPTSHVSASTGLSSFQNGRILDPVTTNCYTMFCTESVDLKTQTSALVFTITFGPQSKITLKIQVGEPTAQLGVKLQSQTLVPMQTTFALSTSDSSQGVSKTSLSGCIWETPLSFGSSPSSSRQLIVTIENQAPSQSTDSTFTVVVTSIGDNDDDGSSNASSASSSNTSSTSSSSSVIGGAVGGAIGGVIVVVIIVLYIRRRNMKMRGRRAQASYEAQNIQQFPQQQPGQPGPFQAQLQGSIIYQPIYPNSPNYSMHQPSSIQYVPIVADPNYQQQVNIQYVALAADPNYQSQPSIRYVPAENYPQSDYQGQGIQLAPPVQMVMPVNPEEGPLSEMNFNHRFPEAPLQNFASSFPQKTCSICLQDLKIDQNCRQLYCEHIFHGECAKDWLLNQMVKQNHGYCPNCNKNMSFVMERAKP